MDGICNGEAGRIQAGKWCGIDEYRSAKERRGDAERGQGEETKRSAMARRGRAKFSAETARTGLAARRQAKEMQVNVGQWIGHAMKRFGEDGPGAEMNRRSYEEVFSDGSMGMDQSHY